MELAGLITDPVRREGARLMAGLVGVGGIGLITDLDGWEGARLVTGLVEVTGCGGARLETDLAVEVRTAGGT